MNNVETVKHAIELIKAGDRKAGGKILNELVKTDPGNELAWMWLSICVDKLDNKRTCLRKTLQINPVNQQARRALSLIEPEPPRAESKAVVSDEEPEAKPPAPEPESKVTLLPDPGLGTENALVGATLIAQLLILFLFWFGKGAIEVGVAFDWIHIAGPKFSVASSFCGAWDVIFGLANLALLFSVRRRSRRAVTNLTLLGVTGIMWGLLLLLFGAAWVQGITIPIYILLIVLAQTNKDYFREMVEERKYEEPNLPVLPA